MTVIAAVQTRTGVYMACDSACTAGDTLTLVRGKARPMTHYVVGVAGDATALCALATAKLGRGQIRSYGDVVQKVALQIDAAGPKGDFDWAGLVASPHGLWWIYPDGGATQVAEPYATLGSGGTIALAVLDALGPSRASLVKAMDAACRRSVTCSGPVYVHRIVTPKP